MNLSKNLKNYFTLVISSRPSFLNRYPYRLSRVQEFYLRSLPRKKITSIKLNHRKIWLSDPYWFVFNCREIFDQQIYKFNSHRQDPLIVDCGTNIGLSIIYYKYLYPQARIICFEPDPVIYKFLERNIEEFELDHIELHQEAVWSSNSYLFYKPDGSLGGKLVTRDDQDNLIKTKTIRLADIMDQPIDFLKLDIEGAEYEVLGDCKNKLNCVDHLFIEYHGDALENQKLHDILLIMSSAGFRYNIKEANPIHHPFIAAERKKMYDLQLNVFGFRE